jgi:dTDP-4-dehydrorhamnose reductase
MLRRRARFDDGPLARSFLFRPIAFLFILFSRLAELSPSHYSSFVMKILITGAGGLIASHFAKRLSRNCDVLSLKHGDLDISEGRAVNQRVVEFRPDLIVNGAVVQVDEAEQNPLRARAVNVEGPRLLAQAAQQIGAELIHFSTQYAFAGEPIGRPPYTINDETCPVNNYGRTKLAGEAAVRLACSRSYIIRTSWVYGSGKDSFLCTVHADLRNGKTVRVIDDIWSSTTYVKDLIDRCLEIVERRRYGTYHIVNEGICSYYEFAQEAGTLVGLARDQMDSLLEVTHECDMKRAAARPRYTPLRCVLSQELGLPPMRHWKAALAAYVAEDELE